MPKRKAAPTRDEARATEEFIRQKELDDLKAILADVRVRDFLWRMLSKCKPFAEAMTANFGMVGHNLGWRAAGMWLWNEISEADFEALVSMQTKNRAEQITADRNFEDERPVEDSE